MKVNYACAEHIEEVLDDAVYEDFSLPVMDLIKVVDKEAHQCAYCQRRAIYIVTNVCSDTKYGD